MSKSKNSFSDLALITQVLVLRDNRAFDKLVKRHQSNLRRFFLNQTLGDRMLSDDLAQETFIKAYLNLGCFNRKSSFSTWLHSIGYNVLFDHIRSRKNYSTEIEDTHTIFLSDSKNSDCTTDIYYALDNLTQIERTCVTLHYMEDISIADICNITGLPSGTIKSHLSRGRVKLSRFLTQNGYE